MASQTITYSDKSKGWTSFWSFIPDWMIGMNSSFYTWKAGCLYKHNTNTTRNAFYRNWSGAGYYAYNSTITTIFNQDSSATKMFKTISLDSNKAWDITVTTDLSTGTIADTYFKEKEGEWYAFIRRADDGSYDTLSMSTQGIGSVASYNAGTYTLTFSFNISNSLATGDKLYKVNGSNTLTLLGTVSSHTTTTITLTGATLSSISANDVIVFVKNAMAESYGARGYYMEVKAESDSTTEVEMFAISTVAHKSNP